MRSNIEHGDKSHKHAPVAVRRCQAELLHRDMKRPVLKSYPSEQRRKLKQTLGDLHAYTVTLLPAATLTRSKSTSRFVLHVLNQPTSFRTFQNRLWMEQIACEAAVMEVIAASSILGLFLAL